MKKIYSLFQQHIAYILLISFLLQSCGGVNHPITPIEEEQTVSLQTTIASLIGQELTAQGGHAITLYEDEGAGELKADVKINAPQGFSKSYEGVNVYIEQGADLVNLPCLEVKAQQRRIHLQPAHGGKPAKIVIYKGAGLDGGMEAGSDEDNTYEPDGEGLMDEECIEQEDQVEMQEEEEYIDKSSRKRKFIDDKQEKENEKKAKANYRLGKVSYKKAKYKKAEKHFKKAKKYGHQKATEYLAKLKEVGHNIDEAPNISNASSSNSPDTSPIEILPSAEPQNVGELCQVLENEIAATEEQIASDSKDEADDGSKLKEKLRKLQEVSKLIQNQPPVITESTDSSEPMDLIAENLVNEVDSVGSSIGTTRDVSSSSSASLSQPTTVTNGKNKILYDISDLKKEMEQIEKKFPKYETRTENPVCLLVGNTGSGKTSLAHWLNNRTLFGKKNPFNDNAYTFENTEDISDGITSKTTEPQMVGDTYVDCPGFDDTRGTLQEIRNALYIQAALRNYKYIKLCLLTPAGIFSTDNTRAKPVVEALENLQKMVKNPDKLTDAFSLIITQYNKTSHSTLGNIIFLLEELSKNTAYEKQKNLLEVLYNNKSRIAFFSAPSGLGEYRNDTEKNILLKTIHNTSPLLLEANDIGVSLSRSAQSDFKEMLQYLANKTRELLEKAAKEIRSYYEERIRGFKGLIDGHVKNAMQHYTPTALIEWAVAGAGITAATAGGATIIGTAGVGITSAMTGGAGIMGTAGAGITAAAGGAPLIPIAIPLVMIGGTIVYKITSNSWKRKLTREFQQLEVEKIKSSLRACAKELRKMRSDGVTDNCLKGTGCLSTSALSEIKTNFDLLSCLYQINDDHNRTRFAQEIWDPTFSKLERTLRYYARESGKFYEEDILKRLVPPSKLKFTIEDFQEDFKELIKQIKANSKVSHISEGFIKTLLINYLEKPYREQDFSLTGSYLSQEELKDLKGYMALCKHIYTTQATPRIAKNCGLALKKKLNTFKINKEIIDRHCQVFSSFYEKKSGVVSQSPKQQRPSTLFTQGGEAPAFSVTEQLPVLLDQYGVWLEDINIFLEEIGKRPIAYEELKELSLVEKKLKEIQLDIDDEYLFYFSASNGQGVRLQGIDATLSNHATVAASFLSAAGVLHKKDKEITILDVGFRNQDDLDWISKIFIEKPVSMVKDNPFAQFGEDGEVNYIAYIEEDLTDRKEDKLLIVYSGSNSTKDWVTNFTVGNQDFLGLSIHDGISQWLNNSEFYNNHNTLIGKISKYYRYHRTPKKFEVITMGHSLGGALALLTAYYYKKEEQVDKLYEHTKVNRDGISVKTFTFGAPPLVNDISKETIESILGKENIFRVWNFDDPIVNLENSRIFKFIQKGGGHVGRSFPLYNINNHSYNLLDTTPIHMGPHQIDRYISYGEILTLGHPSKAREELTAILKKHIETLTLYKRLDSGLSKNSQSVECRSNTPSEESELASSFGFDAEKTPYIQTEATDDTPEITDPEAECTEEIEQLEGANKGIPNIGNTCYINSAMQVLVSLYGDAIIKIASEKKGQLSATLIDLMNTIKSRNKVSCSELKEKANTLLHALREPNKTGGIDWHKDHGRQEDPSELLVKIFDWLEINASETPNHNPPKYAAKYSFKLKAIDPSLNLEITKVDKWGPIWPVELPIDEKKQLLTMQDLFDNSLASEILEGTEAYNWPGHGQIKTSKENYILGDLNKLYGSMLVIHLKRFKTEAIGDRLNYSKVMTEINTPLNLTIRKEKTIDLDQDANYELTGFISHLGKESIHTGHYTAHVKVDDQWIEYNDINVSKVTEIEAEAAAKEAYVYFYKQKA